MHNSMLPELWETSLLWWLHIIAKQWPSLCCEPSTPNLHPSFAETQGYSVRLPLTGSSVCVGATRSCLVNVKARRATMELSAPNKNLLHLFYSGFPHYTMPDLTDLGNISNLLEVFGGQLVRTCWCPRVTILKRDLALPICDTACCG